MKEDQQNPEKGLNVCYFGIYDPKYSRNFVMIKGLQKNSVNVLHCRVECFKNDFFGISDLLLLGLCYLKLVFKYAKVAKQKSIDVILVGYPGWHVMPLAKILSLITHRSVIFDAFYSIYEADVIDRKLVKEGSVQAKLLFLVDKISCDLSDVVLVDTYQHVKYFSENCLGNYKLRRLFVGSDDDIFSPTLNQGDREFLLVTFWGKYIPLHGIGHIVKAAKILENKGVFFKIVGSGQTFKEIFQLIQHITPTNIQLESRWIPYEQLGKLVNETDVCLGIFGDTDKAKRVIPNKVYEALAAGKPLITGDTPAIKEILTNGENCILCKTADSKALADSILLLKNDFSLRNKIAEEGYALFKENFTPQCIGRDLKGIILDLLAR